MGLLSDFFVATADEARQFDASQSPSRLFPSVSAKHVEVVKMVQLQCILDGTEFEDHVKEIDSLFLRTETDDGPWVLTVPPIITDYLATASDVELGRVGERWAATEEWARDSGNPREVTKLVREVASLAQGATEQNRALYLWVSL